MPNRCMAVWRIAVTCSVAHIDEGTLPQARLVLVWVTDRFQRGITAVCNQSSTPTQPPTVSETRNKYRPKCGDALSLGWCKGRHVWFLVNTCHTWVLCGEWDLVKALYKCSVYFTFRLSVSVFLTRADIVSNRYSLLSTSGFIISYFDCCSTGTFVQCLLVCVSVCVRMFFLCVLLRCSFSDCCIYLFSYLAARVFNKLKAYFHLRCDTDM